MVRGLLRLLLAVFAVVASAVVGFVVGVSPIGRAVFVAFGGTPYDGWEGMLTGPAGAVCGVLFVGAALTAKSVRDWNRDAEDGARRESDDQR